MYEVIYFSRGGHTRKLAVAIAGELGVKARHIRGAKVLNPETELFLGSGLYLLRPSKLVRDFILHNDFEGRKVALFGCSTSGIGIEIMGMERLLRQRGAIITGKYHCPGGLAFFRKARPSARDLASAREFARSVASSSMTAEPLGETADAPAAGTSA